MWTGIGAYRRVGEVDSKPRGEKSLTLSTGKSVPSAEVGIGGYPEVGNQTWLPWDCVHVETEHADAKNVVRRSQSSSIGYRESEELL